MPQLVRVNNNLAGWADLASNAGGYATARDQQDYGLRVDAQDESRRNHEQMMARYDEDRQARRDVAAAGVDSRERTAADKLDAGWDKAVMQQAGASARSTAGIAGRAAEGQLNRGGRAAEGQLNRDSREGVAYYGIGQRAEQSQMSREQQAEIARLNREHADQLAKAKATHAAALADTRLDERTRQRVIDRNIQEYQQQRRIVEQRLANVLRRYEQPTWEPRRIGELNDAIAGQVAQAPPPAPALPSSFVPEDVAGPMQAQPQPPQQPQAAPRTATNPQTGQQLYFDEASQQWVPIQ